MGVAGHSPVCRAWRVCCSAPIWAAITYTWPCALSKDESMRQLSSGADPICLPFALCLEDRTCSVGPHVRDFSACVCMSLSLGRGPSLAGRLPDSDLGPTLLGSMCSLNLLSLEIVQALTIAVVPGHIFGVQIFCLTLSPETHSPIASILGAVVTPQTTLYLKHTLSHNSSCVGALGLQFNSSGEQNENQ